PKDHFHLSGGGFTRIELNNGFPGSGLGKVLRCFFREKKINAYSSAATGSAFGRSFRRLGNAVHAKASQRLHVRSKSAVRTDDKNLPHLVKVTAANLHNARIVSPCRAVSAHYQLQFGGDVSICRRRSHGIQMV